MYFSWSEGNQIYDGSALLFDKYPAAQRMNLRRSSINPSLMYTMRFFVQKLLQKMLESNFLLLNSSLQIFKTNIQNNWDEVIMLNVFIEF